MGYYEDEIKRLKDEQKREKDLEDLRKGARCTRDLFNEYLAVGFTEEQAYDLLTIMLKKLV
jgi:hypothetical protein